MNKNILIIGAGEIGTSVMGLYSNNTNYTLYYLDTSKTSDIAINIETLKEYVTIDIMHICIPFIKDFTDVIVSYIRTYVPMLTLIHSTVNTGTTRIIYNSINDTNDSKAVIAYTPVMGIHPNLTESMTVFRKIVGCINEEDKQKILAHFNDIRVTPVFYNNPEEAEAAKLFSTSYYGAIIRFMQDTYEYCEKHNLDFENVYTKTNNIYNSGYKKMDMHHVIRPVLRYSGRGIGGHCVWENSEIILKDIELPSIRNISDEGKNKIKGGFASTHKNDNK